MSRLNALGKEVNAKTAFSLLQIYGSSESIYKHYLESDDFNLEGNVYTHTHTHTPLLLLPWLETKSLVIMVYSLVSLPWS